MFQEVVEGSIHFGPYIQGVYGLAGVGVWSNGKEVANRDEVAGLDHFLPSGSPVTRQIPGMIGGPVEGVHVACALKLTGHHLTVAKGIQALSVTIDIGFQTFGNQLHAGWIHPGGESFRGKPFFDVFR